MEEEKTCSESMEECGDSNSPEQTMGDDCCTPQEMNAEEYEKEIEELKARLARLQADFDNYRRRSRLDLEERTRFGAERVILSLLPVIDNFERALAAGVDQPELAQFVAGMELIYRQLKEALEKEGMAVIPAVNEAFDPTKHHAIAQVETDEYEENTIVDEIHKGYIFHDKVLRPSAVRVAKQPETE